MSGTRSGTREKTLITSYQEQHKVCQADESSVSAVLKVLRRYKEVCIVDMVLLNIVLNHLMSSSVPCHVHDIFELWSDCELHEWSEFATESESKSFLQPVLLHSQKQDKKVYCYDEVSIDNVRGLEWWMPVVGYNPIYLEDINFNAFHYYNEHLTLLHLAVHINSVYWCDWLLQRGLDVNAEDDDGQTCIHICKNDQILDLLIPYAANVNALSCNHANPLHSVTSVYAAKKLLEAECNLEQRDSMKCTPIHYSANPEILKLFIDYKANIHSVSVKKGTPLHTLCSMTNDPNIIQQLIDSKADIHARDGSKKTPLYLAKEESIVQVLLQNKANVRDRDDWKRTPLFFAAESTNHNIVNLLVHAGAEVNARDVYHQTPICRATSWSIVDALISYGAKIDVPGIQHNMVEMDATNAVRTILARSANIKATLIPERPLTFLAKSLEMQQLLAPICGMQEKDIDGQGLLHNYFERYLEEESILKYIIQHTPHPNLQDNNFVTPIMLAIWDGRKEDIQTLLDHQTVEELNQVNTKGETALFLAVARKRLFIAESIFLRGADITLKNRAGVSPFVSLLKSNKYNAQNALLMRHEDEDDSQDYDEDEEEHDDMHFYDDQAMDDDDDLIQDDEDDDDYEFDDVEDNDEEDIDDGDTEECTISFSLENILNTIMLRMEKSEVEDKSSKLER